MLKRILALLGVVILAGMYILTLIFALIDSPVKNSLLTASLYCTVIIPILLYVFFFLAKAFSINLNTDKDDTSDDAASDIDTIQSDCVKSGEDISRDDDQTDKSSL